MELQELAFDMTSHGIKFDVDRQAYHHDMLSRLAGEEHRGFLELAKDTNDMDDDFWRVDLGKWWLQKQKSGPKQLFYDHLGVPCKHFSKETGAPSLSKNALRDMIGEEPKPISTLARHMFMFNQWAKLDSTYARGLKPIEGVMHPMWSAGLKVTRRWGSSPKMQNIPYDIWEEFNEKDLDHQRLMSLDLPTMAKGDATLLLTRPGLRDMFIARPGMYLVAADYSQLELRILALLTGDKILLEAYAKGRDVHDMNAQDLFGVSIETTPKEEYKALRRLAKNFVYGCNYGASPHTVWLNLVPSFPELKEQLIEHLYEVWFETHHWITEWQAKQWAFARKNSFTDSALSGHRYYHYWGRVKPTIAYNFPIQEEAGRIMNQAMLKVQARLNHDEHILMNVHDEMVCEGPDPQRLGRILKECMEDSVTLNGQTMEYPVDPVFGTDWGHMEDLELAA